MSLLLRLWTALRRPDIVAAGDKVLINRAPRGLTLGLSPKAFTPEQEARIREMIVEHLYKHEAKRSAATLDAINRAARDAMNSGAFGSGNV